MWYIGYYVVAPDLLGHGVARCPSASASGGEYTVAALAADLHPHLHSSESTLPISLIIGHSLGALAALTLIPSLLPNPNSNSGLRLILVDPPLELSLALLPAIRASCIAEVTDVPSLEAYAKENPLWTRRDVAGKVTGALLCTAEAVGAIVDVCVPSVSLSSHG